MGAKTGRAGTNGRRPWPILAASVLIHGLVLGVLGFHAPQARWPLADRSPPISVSLVRTTRAAASQPAAETPVTRGSAPARSRASPEAEPASSAPSPVHAAASPAPGTSGSPDASAGILPAEAGVRDALRSLLGCQSGAERHMTEEEKIRCSRPFAEAARTATPFSGIDPAKRAAYAAQAAADERKRAARDGAPAEVIVSCGGFGQAHDFPAAGGSNLGGGCLPDSAIGHVRIP
jgi:hypothetical protein